MSSDNPLTSGSISGVLGLCTLVTGAYLLETLPNPLLIPLAVGTIAAGVVFIGISLSFLMEAR